MSTMLSMKHGFSVQQEADSMSEPIGRSGTDAKPELELSMLVIRG